jgi:hypothetical protein
MLEYWASRLTTSASETREIREVRGRSMRRDLKDQLDFADIGGETNAAAHTGEDNGTWDLAKSRPRYCVPRRERLENIVGPSA